MQKFEKIEDGENTINCIVNGLGLQATSDGHYTMVNNCFRGEFLPEDLFCDFVMIQPDVVLRPQGDTTVFTTAAIQHLETMEHDDGVLKKQKFQLWQPVIRSQYLDNVTHGRSTSFINRSMVSVGESVNEFIQMCRSMIEFSLSRVNNLEKYYLTIHEEADRWGDKKFQKIVLTLYYNNQEVSEGVFIEKFPKKNSSDKISVAEVCWGVERFNWVYAENSHDKESRCYFPEFSEMYKNGDPGEVESAIDPVRTATLMVMQGVVPSHQDPGFRLRQLITRFMERNQKLGLSLKQLISLSLDFWQVNGVRNMVKLDELYVVFDNEFERSYNVFLAREIEKAIGRSVRVNVNQTTLNFINTIRRSSPIEIVDALEVINKNAYDI